MNSPGIVTDDITVIASTLPLAPAAAKSDLRNRYNHDHNEESFFARMWSNKVNPIDKRIHQQSSTLVSIDFTYTVITANAVGMLSSEKAFVAYANLLNESVTNGYFDAYLQVNAGINQAAGLSSSFAGMPIYSSVFLPTAEPTLAPVEPPTPDVAGTQKSIAIAFGVLFGIVMFSSLYYHCYQPLGNPYGSNDSVGVQGMDSSLQETVKSDAKHNSSVDNRSISLSTVEGMNPLRFGAKGDVVGETHDDL